MRFELAGVFTLIETFFQYAVRFQTDLLLQTER